MSEANVRISNFEFADCCTPIGIRTPNLLVRSQTLYPVELWAQVLQLQ